MATITGKTKQLSPDNNPYVVRTPFVHPNDYRPGMDASRWRLIAAEPVNKMARRMIQREVGSLNWIIRQTDNENENQRAAAVYYSEVFADFRNLANRVLKGVCELPQGGAWEVGWMPAKFGEARGTVAFIDFIDAGTLHPTTSQKLPIVQIDPLNSLRRVHFQEHQLVRILANPRDEYDREWWQESPTEASFLQIEALARLYTFSLKKLLDTPPVGILDLMDFSQDSAKKWADSFRQQIEGIDPIKMPVLYEHEKPAQYISLANDFQGLAIGEQFQRFAELVLANYGLSIDDLRIFGHASSKAGMAVSQKTTVRSGINFFAELIKDAVQSVLPDFLTFEYSEPDVDEERSKAQIRAADARTLQTLTWLPVRHRVELAKRQGLLGDLDVDPEEIEKEAEEMAEKLLAQQAGSTSPPGAGGTNIPKVKPGQLERGEGRNPDLLEDESKRQAARGPRIFAKGLVEDATERVKAFYPKDGQRYGKKTTIAAEKFRKLLIEQFRRIGTQITVEHVQQLLDAVYTQFPDAVQQPNAGQPTIKSWVVMVERFLDEHYVEKQDERGTAIQELIEQALEEATYYSLGEEEFLVRLMEILTLAYEDGLLGIAESVQANLFSRGKVPSPGVNTSFRVTDPRVIGMLGVHAAELVQNVDQGTKFYLRRMIVEGALQGLSADELTDRIKADLFVLPEEEAAKLPASRILSIVNTELNRADSLGRLAQMTALGLKTKRWVTRKVDVCPVCIRNEALGVMPMEYMYESVFRLQDFQTPAPPAHPRTCHCHIAMVGEELDQLTANFNFWTGGTDRPEKAEFEKYDDDPNRYPAGSEKVVAGRKAGGTFAPKNGKDSSQNGKKTVSTNGDKPAAKKPTPKKEPSERSEFEETDAATYLRERAKTEFASMLTPYTEKELAESGKQIYEHDGVLYMIDRGDLQGIVNVSGRRGAGAEGIIDGIARGGKTLDCYGGFLDSYYVKFGFVETERLKFDPQYAPDNWDFERFDNPDVVFMEYPEGLSRDRQEVRKRFESAGERTKSEAGRSDRQDGVRGRGVLSEFARRFDRATRRKMGPKVSGLREGASGLHAESDVVSKHDPSPIRDPAGRFTYKPQTKRRGKNTAGDLYYMVRFRETRAIRRLADYAKEFIGTEGINWEAEDNYHTTLVFLPDIPEHMIEPTTEGLEDLPSVPLGTDRFGTFSTERGDPSNVLFLKVQQNPELRALFEKVYDQAEAAGVKISDYSRPETWKPHITLAYSDTPFDESKLPEIGGVGLGSLQIDATVDRSLVNQSPPEEDVFEPVEEKYDDDPNREPAGTSKKDSTGGGAGGQFAPKNGESTGDADVQAGLNKKDLARIAKQRVGIARQVRHGNVESQDGPDNEVYIPHTQGDTDLMIPIQSSLDYEAELFFPIPGQWTEEEMEAVRYYFDALHASDFLETPKGNELPPYAELTLRRLELKLIGMDHEVGYSVKPDGSLVHTLDGTLNQINLVESDIEKMRGNYFTHSHPVERPLSPNDVVRAIKDRLPEVRAVSPAATYRWSFNDLGIPLDEWMAAIDVEFMAMDYAVDAIGNTDDKTAAEMAKLQHAGLVRLAERFGSTYTREPHDA